jgi:predicted alpha/beta hydrolase family esterase
MKDNYIIVHGSFGSKDGNWFPWLKNILKGKDVVVPQMPVGVGNQNFESWSRILDKLKIDENTIIIAHSIAPIFVCKYLIANKIKVKKLIFVCGFNNYLGINEEYDTVNKTMFTDNLEEIKNYCDDIICYFSNNDPYVKYEAEKEFADTIGAKQIFITDGGHLNSESGYETFKELLENI